MAEPERRRRRPTTACSVCRQRKTRCDRQLPCSSCTRSRRKDACVYEDELPQHRRQTVQQRAQRVIHESPRFLDEAPPAVSNSTGASHAGSTAPSTFASTVVGSEETPAASSEPVEAMRRSRIRDLEGQLYKASPESVRISCQPVTAIETTSTHMTANFYVHRGDKRLFGQASSVFGQASLVSRSISHKTRLFGQSHWINGIVPLIRDLVELIDPYFRDNPPALANMHRCKLLARAIKAQRAPPWPCPPTPDLPPRELADELVDRYLETIESVYRIVHVPSFKEQYNALWDSPGQPSDDRSFLVQVKLVLALGAVTYDKDFSLRNQAVRWIYEAQTFLSEPIFKSRLRIQVIQTRILLLLAEELVDVSGDATWVSAGSLIRIAITMGLHRDPSQLPRMEPLTVEMRRRLWNTILELSLQASIAKGCPPLISMHDFDTQGPSNLEDEDLTGDLAHDFDLERISTSDHRRVSIASALRHTFPVRLKVAKFLNDLESGSGTYEEALKLDSEVRGAVKELRQRLRAYQSDKPPSQFAIRAVDFMMSRYLSALHMPFLGASMHESAYAFSRKIVVDNALKVWSTTWPSSSINSGYPTTTTTATTSTSSSSPTAVNGEDDLLSRLIMNGSGFLRTVAVEAVCIIPSELAAQLQEDQGLGPTPLRRDLLAVAEEARTWCLRCIQSGETSAKGYLMSGILVANIEGLRRGLSREERARALVEAVEQAGETCVPVLEEVERRTRSGDTRRGEDGQQTDDDGGPSGIPLGLTAEWGFSMPDAVFTGSDGSLDWNFGGGTMQGLSFW